MELFSLPSGKGRCRLLYRKYSNFTSWRERLKPRWLEHLTQCTILEQDMRVVVGQHAQTESLQRPLRDLWLPLRSSDRLVVEYRRWLDRFGGDLPFYRGFETAKNSGPTNPARTSMDRLHLHQSVCSTCARLDQRLNWSINVLWGIAALSAALAATTTASVYAVASLLSVAAITALKHLKSKLQSGTDLP